MAAPAPAPVPVPLPEPLRLPRGTVHGFLALILLGTFGYLLLRGALVPQVLVNATVVVLAFYFGTRGFQTPQRTPEPVVESRWRRPTVVRALLLLGFGGLGVWYLRSDPNPLNLPAPLLQVLQVLLGYVIGLTLSWLIHRRAHESLLRRRLALLFRDLSALGALGLSGFACYALATGILGAFSTDVEQALSLVITYYFGSRVLAH